MIDYPNSYYAGQMARYYYRKGMVAKCYRELIRSSLDHKTIGLFLTAWSFKLRQYVLTHFKVSNIG